MIMHSGTGEGMHADGEYVVWQSVEELARIQMNTPEKSGECLKREEIPGSGKGGKRRQNRCFPLCGPMAAEAVEEENLCVSGEGLALPGVI